jgi:hypothetical protein
MHVLREIVDYVLVEDVLYATAHELRILQLEHSLIVQLPARLWVGRCIIRGCSSVDVADTAAVEEWASSGCAADVPRSRCAERCSRRARARG